MATITLKRPTKPHDTRELDTETDAARIRILKMRGWSDVTGKPAEKPNATDGALELAKESGLDVATLMGTGAGGRVTVEDVRAAAKAQSGE